MSALTNSMNKRIWTFLPETLRMIDHNNDECINEPHLNYLIAFSQRRPISPTTCLTKRKTWTQLLLGEDDPILLFVELIVEIVCIKTKKMNMYNI